MDLLERAPVLDELDGVLATATTGGRVVLQIMFGIGGERDLTERELPTCRAGRGPPTAATVRTRV